MTKKKKVHPLTSSSVVVLALVLTIPIAASLPSTAHASVKSREVSVFAQATWVTESSEGQSLGTLFFVRESTGTPDSENELTVVRDIELDGEIVTLQGSIFTQEDLFSIDDKNLNTASLPPTDITVCVPFGDICEALTIQADWTGVGDIEKSTSKSFSKDKEEDFKIKIKGTALVREAVATGSIDSEDLGKSENAELRMGELVTQRNE